MKCIIFNFCNCKSFSNDKELQKDNGRDYPQIIAIFTATLVTLTMGIQFTWPSPTFPRLLNINSTDHLPNTNLEEVSWLTMLPSLSLVVASPIISYYVDIIGRKRMLLLSTIPHIFTWSFIAYGGTIYVYYIGRLINGIGDAITFTTVSVYIAEVATPRVRGTWGNAITFSAYIGNFIMNLVGSYNSIRTTSLIFVCIPILMIMVGMIIPETPYFYLMKDRESDARASLQWLRRKQNVDEELNQMQQDVKRQQTESGRYIDILAIDSNRRALFSGAMIRAAQQFCGISAIGVYTQLIFAQLNFGLSAVESTLLMSGLLAIGNFAAGVTLSRIGRRKAMFISTLGSGIALTAISIFFYIDSDVDSINTSAMQWFPLLCLITYVPFYSIGLGIIPTVIAGEIFSSSIKGKAMCMMNIFFAIFMSISTKLFQVLLSTVGMWAGFSLFAVCCLLCCVTSRFFVPETTGKTLEEIQQNFKKQPTKK